MIAYIYTRLCNTQMNKGYIMNTKLKICAAVLATTLATSASAGVVTEWTYNNQAGFASWTGTTNTTNTADDVAASGNSSTGTNAALTDDANNILITGNDVDLDGQDDALNTSLTWGTPANGFGSGSQSALNVDSPVTGNLMTNDWAWANGTSVTHENWVIIGDALDTATLLDGLTLTPTNWTANPGDPDPTVNAPFLAPQLQFGIDFWETNNGGSGGMCPNGEPNFVGDNVNGCGDIFEVTGLASLPITPVVGPNFLEFTVPFVMLDAANNPIPGWSETIYYVTTRLSGLTTLPAGYTCQTAAPCYGFVTQEQQSNQLLAQFKIRTVPEPTTIALFGLGLIATGFFGRKQKS